MSLSNALTLCFEIDLCLTDLNDLASFNDIHPSFDYMYPLFDDMYPSFYALYHSFGDILS